MVKRQRIYFLLFFILITSSIFSIATVTAKKTEASQSLWDRFISSTRSLGVKLMLNKCPDFLSFEQKEKLATLYGTRFMSWLCAGAENSHSHDNEPAIIALRLFEVISRKASENEQIPLPEKLTNAVLDQLTDQELNYIRYGQSGQGEQFEKLTKDNLKRRIRLALKYLDSTFFSFSNEDEIAKWH